jgi:CBS domain-containing protein
MNVESVLKRKGTEVATIAPEASIKRAADWLRAKNVGALVVTSNDVIRGIISERDIVPVLHNGRLVGIIGIGDVVKHRLDDLELEASVLRDVYIASH